MHLIGFIDLSDRFVAPLAPIFAAEGARYVGCEDLAGQPKLVPADPDLAIESLSPQAWSWAEDFSWASDVLFRLDHKIFCCQRSQRSLLLHGLLCLYRKKLVLDGWRSSLAMEIPESSTVIGAILADRDSIFASGEDRSRQSFLSAQFARARATAGRCSLLEEGVERETPADVPGFARLRSTEFNGRATEQLLAKCVLAILNEAGLDRFTAADVMGECWHQFGQRLTERDVYAAVTKLLAAGRSQRESAVPNHILDQLCVSDFYGQTVAATFPDRDRAALLPDWDGRDIDEVEATEAEDEDEFDEDPT